MLDMADTVADRPYLRGKAGVALPLDLLQDRRRIDSHGEQIGADLVMKVARQLSPLVFLNCRKLLGETPVVGLEHHQPVDHRIKAARQPPEFGRSLKRDMRGRGDRTYVPETTGQTLQRCQRPA